MISSMHRLKETLKVRLFGLLKIPLIAYLKPVVEEVNDDYCTLRFPLMRRSRNHLNAMYFGALCVGADCAGGLIAMREIQARGNRVTFLFKDFKAEFLKRAEGDVCFTCQDGATLRELVRRAEASDQRVEDTVTVVATVPAKLGDTPVARFQLTISLKQRSR
jgi:acyl-coenzyme A thioesterase PaaI-like protein